MTEPLHIEDVMSAPILECAPGAPLHEAARLMAEAGCSSILVVDGDQAAGIWTERDILGLDLSDPDLFDQPIARHMSAPVKTIDRHLPLDEAAMAMRSEGVRHCLAVDDGGRRCGIVSQTDLVLNQGIDFFLHMRDVGSIMGDRPLLLPAAIPVHDAARQMSDAAVEATLVAVDGGETGIITERDIVALAARRRGREPVGDHARRPVVTIRSEESVFRARSLFMEHHIRHLVVTGDGGKPSGLLGFAELLKCVEQSFMREVRAMLTQHQLDLARSNRRLRLAEHVIESSPNGIAVIDDDFRIISANHALCQLTGLDVAGIEGLPLSALAACGSRAALAERRGHSGEAIREETWLQGSDGREIPVLLSLTPIPDGDAKAHLSAIFTDLTQIHANRRELAEESARLRAIFDHVPEGLLFTDAAFMIESANPAFTRITGHTLDEVAGRPLAEMLCGPDPEERWREIEGRLLRNGEWRGDSWSTRVNGECFPVGMGISVVRDLDGQPVGHVVIFSDVTEIKRHEEDLTRQAQQDPLTGLPNRRLLEDRLDQGIRLARRQGTTLAVMLIDLDDFKPLNDEFGHETGDQALRTVGERLQRLMRGVDTVARIGGDEFVILATSVARPEDARKVAEMALAAIGKPIVIDDREHRVGASVGISLFPDDGDDAEALMRHADRAMYQAKNRDTGHLVFWHEVRGA